jgi:hypothetical protein
VSLEAVHVSIDEEETDRLILDWAKQNIQVPLNIVASPYRDISWPLICYIKDRRAEYGSEVVTVYTPIYIVGHWWESLLHNHKARRLRQKLMLVHGVTIALVPWLLDSSELIYGRRSRPIPGQERRGEPVRSHPIPRRPLAPATLETASVTVSDSEPSGPKSSPASPPPKPRQRPAAKKRKRR